MCIYSCWQEQFICCTREYVLTWFYHFTFMPFSHLALSQLCCSPPVLKGTPVFLSFFLCAERREYEGNKSAVLGLAELQIHQGFILLCLPLFTFGSHGMSHLSYWGSHSQDIWPEYFIFEVIYPVVCFHFY